MCDKNAKIALRTIDPLTKSSSNSDTPVGVIGAGSFGTAIANLLAYNVNVLLYSRNKDLVEKINNEHENLGRPLSPNVRATNDLEEVARRCTLIFPIVPSTNFRSMMKDLSPYLRPYHLLIHGTKGLDLDGLEESAENLSQLNITRAEIHTMSEVILQESVVVRVGCLSGPNLSSEIMAGQPTATVIASRFSEVIKAGRQVLDSKKFHVFGSHEILGAEMAGALKNAIAIGSGMLGGLGLGKNIQAMLITRGLVEMVYFGKVMGANSSAFIGTAGIGDLVATATSTQSRNYTFGMRLAQGETLEQIQDTMPELAEGVRTIKIMQQLSKQHKMHVPITNMLYSVIFEGFDIERAINYLMNYPYAVDVDFL
ncbi:MAG: NAD(P)H-dependent glycerol-3-phosphate dehydrogenase [Bacteroidota bacterium]